MSTPEFTSRGGVLLRLLRFRPRLGYVAAVLVFLGAVAQFHEREYGFSSLLSIGNILDATKVTALQRIPHHVYEDSAGYDGAYYVQLAFYPTLDNPELNKAIDNLPYRAKRILMSWVSWVVGLGRPAWILQAHALVNVVCWLVLAWVLLRWFPPVTWGNFARWGAVMFTHGLCMSVRHSLVDGPSLLLVALAQRWLEDGRRGAGGVALALGGLSKETSLLACAGWPWNPREPRSWGRVALAALATALPLFAWMAYIRWRFGPAEDPGFGNFTVPLAGLVEKIGVCVRDVVGADTSLQSWATLAAVVALVVQGGFFLVRWRPEEPWWRVGAVFAAMMLFLSTPVWEGYPGAATRVLLPMTLAFNLLVPRGVRWWPLLLAGNLTVGATVFEYSPPVEFYTVRGDRVASAAVLVVPGANWHGPEENSRHRWRWTAGDTELLLRNTSAQPVRVAVTGQASAVEGERWLRISAGERLLWGDQLGSKTATEFRFGLVLPPGETVLTFRSNQPARKVGTDPRQLAFQVANLEIVVHPVGVAR